MDQATLVGPDIQTGSQVVDVLVTAGVKPLIALLALFPEYEDWWLVLSSPVLNQEHTLQAQEQVAKLTQGRLHSSSPYVMVLPQKSLFIKQLKKFFAGRKDVTGMRLGGQRIGDRYLVDGFVYRIK